MYVIYSIMKCSSIRHTPSYFSAAQADCLCLSGHETEQTELWLHCWNKRRDQCYLIGKPESLLNWKTVILLLEIFHFNFNINSKAWNPISNSIFKAQTTQGGRGWTAETSACLKSLGRQGWLNSETIGGQTKGLGTDQGESLWAD